MYFLLLASEAIKQESSWGQELNNLFTTLISVIIPTFISYIVARTQIKSAEKSLNKQIEAEVKNMRMHYEYEQKRDNTNFLTRIRIEEASHLIESMIFMRNNAQIYPLYLIKTDHKTTEYTEFMERFDKETKDIIIYANYFPNLKKEILEIINQVNITVIPIFTKDQDLDGSDIQDIRIKTSALSRAFGDILLKISDEVEKEIKKLER